MSDYFKDILNEEFDDNNDINNQAEQPENTDELDIVKDDDYTKAEDTTDTVAYDTQFTNPYSTPVQQTQPVYNSYNNYETQNSYNTQNQSYNGSYQNTNSGANTQPYTNAYTGAYAHQYQQQYNQTNTNPYTYPVQTPVSRAKESKGVSKGFVAVMLIISVLISSTLGFVASVLYGRMKVADAEISDNGAMIINKVEIDEQTAEKLADKPTSQITDEVADTVVEITTEVMSTNSFYGQYISQGAGSGVIVSTDGYIITNNHVIDGASSITVTLRDKTTYKAKLVGTDSIIDVAVLKIDATNLKAANFGDSDKLKVGDKAVAIGNPLGQLGGTVTDGIISALDRDVVIDDETMSLLQTDSAINPGNSGGGLFDGQGALIGLVVAKSSGEEIEGLGFAIPINDVVDILDDLKEYGYVRGRVTTGMQLMDLSNSMYSMYYYGNSQDGCYVYSVDFDSAAYNAGIQQGDRIVSVDGKKIETAADVEAVLDDKKVGDVVSIEIERGTRTATVEVELKEYIPQDQVASQNIDDIFNPFA